MSQKQQNNSRAIVCTPVDYLSKRRNEIEKFCSSRTSVNVIMRSALLAFDESDRLRQALETRTGQNSVYHAMLRAASTGLSLNPLEGKACLVPYYRKEGKNWITVVNYQIMKNGLIHLALRSGQIDHISADVVRENDEFKIRKTAAGDEFEFSPALTGRGKAVGCYASVKFKNGESKICYMSWEEIDEHRERYSQSYQNDLKDDKKESPWSKSPESMGLKTVLKRLFNNTFISDEVTKAVTSDDKAEANIIDVQPEKISTSKEVAKQLLDKENSKQSKDRAKIAQAAADSEMNEEQEKKQVGF